MCFGRYANSKYHQKISQINFAVSSLRKMPMYALLPSVRAESESRKSFWKNTNKKWPSPLHKIMNYIDDLSSYWVKGYGYPINYDISCVLFNNFVDAIDTVINNPVTDHSLKATLRFGHAETIMPFLRYHRTLI